MIIRDYVKSDEALRVYDQFMASVERSVRMLENDDRQEIKDEITSHLYEYMTNSTDMDSELNKLLTAIERLGKLDEMLDPLVADKMIEYASKSIRPGKLLTAFESNYGRQVNRIILASIFTLFWLFLLVATSLALIKIFNPAVGLYVGPDVFVLGTVDDSSNANEILGYWIIPIAFIIALLGYFIVHRFLRLLKRS